MSEEELMSCTDINALRRYGESIQKERNRILRSVAALGELSAEEINKLLNGQRLYSHLDNKRVFMSDSDFFK